MKSLNAIQLELLREGFRVTGGMILGERHCVRIFQRDEGENSFSIVRVNFYNFEEGEEIEAEEEGLEEELFSKELLRRFPHFFRDSDIIDLLDFDDRAFIISKLVSRYPDEIVKLINAGQLDVPKWILKELEGRKVKR